MRYRARLDNTNRTVVVTLPWQADQLIVTNGNNARVFLRVGAVDPPFDAASADIISPAQCVAAWSVDGRVFAARLGIVGDIITDTVLLEFTVNERAPVFGSIQPSVIEISGNITIPAGVNVNNQPGGPVTNAPNVGVPAGVAISNIPTVGITGTPQVSIPGGTNVNNQPGGPVTNAPNVGVPAGVAINNVPTVGITGTPQVSIPGGTNVNNQPGGPVTNTPNVGVPSGVSVTNQPGGPVTNTPNVGVPSGVSVTNQPGGPVTNTPGTSIINQPNMTPRIQSWQNVYADTMVNIVNAVTAGTWYLVGTLPFAPIHWLGYQISASSISTIFFLERVEIAFGDSVGPAATRGYHTYGPTFIAGAQIAYLLETGMVPISPGEIGGIYLGSPYQRIWVRAMVNSNTTICVCIPYRGDYPA